MPQSNADLPEHVLAYLNQFQEGSCVDEHGLLQENAASSMNDTNDGHARAYSQREEIHLMSPPHALEADGQPHLERRIAGNPGAETDGRTFNEEAYYSNRVVNERTEIKMLCCTSGGKK